MDGSSKSILKITFMGQAFAALQLAHFWHFFGSI